MLLPNIYLRNQNFAARELFENRPAEYNWLVPLPKSPSPPAMASMLTAEQRAKIAPAKYICAELKFRWRVRINARPREIYFSQN